MWSRSASMTPMTVCSAPTTRCAPAPVARIRSVTASMSAEVASGWKMTSMGPGRWHKSPLPTIEDMTTKASFNAEDWAVVTTAPALAGLFIAAAEPGGNLRESVALSRAYAEARNREPGELLQAVLSTAPSLDPATRPKTPDDIRAVALDQLRRAVRTIDRHAHDDELVE